MSKKICHIPAFYHSDNHIISYVENLCYKNSIYYELNTRNGGVEFRVETSLIRDEFKKILLIEFKQIIMNLELITETRLNPPIYIQ